MARMTITHEKTTVSFDNDDRPIEYMDMFRLIVLVSEKIINAHVVTCGDFSRPSPFDSPPNVSRVG